MILNHDTVAFVTGGAAGIGRATATMLAGFGVKVVSFDRDDASNTLLQQEYPGIYGISCDCTDMQQIKRSFEEAISCFGKVDVLVNNAGDFLLSSFLHDSYEAGIQGLERMLRLFVGSTYAFTQLAAPFMARAGGGAIVNVLTNHLHRDICRVSSEEHAYDAAKYAQMSLNMSMAAELKPYGIRVNAVDPAATYTKMLQDYFAGKGMETTVENIARTTKTGSLMMPEDVALAVCNLIQWEDPAPVGRNYLIQFRPDCEKLKDPPCEV